MNGKYEKCENSLFFESFGGTNYKTGQKKSVQQSRGDSLEY